MSRCGFLGYDLGGSGGIQLKFGLYDLEGLSLNDSIRSLLPQSAIVMLNHVL